MTHPGPIFQRSPVDVFKRDCQFVCGTVISKSEGGGMWREGTHIDEGRDASADACSQCHTALPTREVQHLTPRRIIRPLFPVQHLREKFTE